jgi:inner membrane protein
METTSRQPEPHKPYTFQQFMRSHTARFIIVGFISLVLLIPLVNMSFLIGERKMRQNDVVDELKTEWGSDVSYHGVILKVPVKETRRITVTNEETKSTSYRYETVDRTGYIFPQQSTEKIRANVTEKYRGIFSTPVFAADMSSNASFDIAALKNDSARKGIDWTKVQILLVTNPEARFRKVADFHMNGRSYPIEYQSEFAHSYLLNASAPIDLSGVSSRNLQIAVTTSLNGSQAIHYQSFATRSTMHMQSNWKDPAFAGTSLPNGNAPEISKNGFERTWNNVEIGNGKSALHIDQIPAHTRKFSDVRFITPVDHYQLNERTVKYGLLVLTLTFAVFFLIQIVGKIAIHPLHYFMIGLALILFYCLLLSFSEQIGFTKAYLIASATIVLLIAWYAKSILRSLKFAIMSGLSLSLLYAFLLVIVNLEVYALIVGSIGLLLALIAIMSVTRKLNFES